LIAKVHLTHENQMEALRGLLAGLQESK